MPPTLPLNSPPEEFHQAAEHGRLRSLVQDRRMDPDAPGRDGRTALSWAAETGNVPVARFLLSHPDTKADLRDDQGRTALTMAAHWGRVEVVKLLLERQDVNPDWPDGFWQQTPLFRAAKEGWYEVVVELLKRGEINCNARDRHGQTPLAVAAGRGHFKVVLALLEAGADPNLKDCEGRNAVSRAEIRGRPEVTNILRQSVSQGSTDDGVIVPETPRTETDLSEPSACVAPSGRAIFFDSQQSEVDRDSKKWINDFINFRKSIFRGPFNPATTRRVRVTVIDTGIDVTHPFIQQAWSRVRWDGVPLFEDFTALDQTIRPDPTDQDGHGTFIAGLILQLAPDVELSVARIVQDRTRMKDDREVQGKIAKAIDHALCKWEADVISISFGLDDISKLVTEAINKAVGKNVILLASVGNSGNKKEVGYPARYDGVFKIFATTAQDWADDMSPPTHNMDTRYCFGILGCSIESTWPSGLKAKARNKNLGFTDRSVGDTELWTTMSGTSFAAPIAASLVAITYQFYRTYKGSIKIDPNSGDFRTIAVVRSILLKMSRPEGRRRGELNVLSPELGRDNHFKYNPARDEDKTAFYARKLADAIWAGQ